MIPILFAGHPQGSSLGLVAASEWLGQPYRIARVLMPDDMLDDAYARVNPRRETPVLIREDGQPLTETLAITHWLAARDTNRRISFPEGSPDALRLHQLTAFLNSSFTGAFIPLWTAMESQDASPQVKQVLQETGRQAVAHRHAQLEAMLGDGPYLVGKRPTLADAVFVGVARWADFHSAVDPSAYPKIRALKQRLHEDPAVRFAQAIEDGTPQPGSGAMAGLVPLADALQQANVG